MAHLQGKIELKIYMAKLRFRHIEHTRVLLAYARAQPGISICATQEAFVLRRIALVIKWLEQYIQQRT